MAVGIREYSTTSVTTTGKVTPSGEVRIKINRQVERALRKCIFVAIDEDEHLRSRRAFKINSIIENPKYRLAIIISISHHTTHENIHRVGPNAGIRFIICQSRH